MRQISLLVAVFPRRLDREFDLVDYVEAGSPFGGSFAGSFENEGTLIWIECQTGTTVN